MIKLFALWNLIAFFLMGYDKKQSRKRGQRISERVLLFFSLAGGGIGAFIGSKVFHHKTKKTAFRILLPLGGIISLLLLFYLVKGGPDLLGALR